MRDEITIAINLDGIVAKAFDERGIADTRYFALTESLGDEDVVLNLELWAIVEGSDGTL